MLQRLSLEKLQFPERFLSLEMTAIDIQFIFEKFKIILKGWSYIYRLEICLIWSASFFLETIFSSYDLKNGLQFWRILNSAATYRIILQ